jgi:periplasmic divalent cation tolerance protein
VQCVQVQFTIDDADTGDAIVTDLLERRLIACAQTVGAIASRYWWEGAINEADEVLILCKTAADRLDAVIDSIRRGHPYATPEIIACEIAGGLESYLDWIVEQTRVTAG